MRIRKRSIECRKTKTKVIILANQKDGDNPVNKSKLKVITRSRHKARENVHARGTIGENGAETFQSLSEVMQNQSRDGAVVRALASHQCGPGSIPGLGVICGLSLLVLYSALRGFLRVLRFLLSSKTNS